MNRRTTIKKLLLGATIPFMGETALSAKTSFSSSPPLAETKQPLYLFTKVLQWVPLQDLAQTVQDLGFGGIDIAVRNNGHFTVEELKEKLPSLITASQRLGLATPILTTELTGENLRESEEFLKIVSGEGIRHYRMGWLKYKKPEILKELETYNGQLKKLAELHEKYQVQGHYQNHAGNGVGGSVWELLYLLEGIDPQHIGIQYDLRHAVVEGYRSWENGFHVIKDKITTLDIKDFRWKESSGKDYPLTVPLGEGNVDFSKIASSDAFKSASVPKILHVEHDLGGAEHGSREPSLPGKEILAAIQKDFQYFSQHFGR
jgi:L-ribulose-5-phosphate 3-epimerase